VTRKPSGKSKRRSHSSPSGRDQAVAEETRQDQSPGADGHGAAASLAVEPLPATEPDASDVAFDDEASERPMHERGVPPPSAADSTPAKGKRRRAGTARSPEWDRREQEVVDPPADDARGYPAGRDGSEPSEAEHGDVAELAALAADAGPSGHEDPSRGDGEPDGDDPDAGDLDEDAVAATLPTSANKLSEEQLRGLVEALVFASDKPLTVARLRQLTRVSDSARLQRALDQLTQHYLARGLALTSVSGGYQFRTESSYSPWVQQLITGRPVRLSRAQLETLAIIAYRQPITRPEIDEIRGVDSSGTLKMLMDRNLVRILGKREEVGRPMLYGTTREFLDFFSLGDLRELPTLREYSELSAESLKVVSKLGFDEPASAIPVTAPPQGSAVDERAGTLADESDDGTAADVLSAADIESADDVAPAADIAVVDELRLPDDTDPEDTDPEDTDPEEVGSAELGFAGTNADDVTGEEPAVSSAFVVEDAHLDPESGLGSTSDSDVWYQAAGDHSSTSAAHERATTISTSELIDDDLVDVDLVDNDLVDNEPSATTAEAALASEGDPSSLADDASNE
jgi:segregation and condensation protein B